MASGLDRLVPSKTGSRDPDSNDQEEARLHLAVFGPSLLERTVKDASKDAMLVLFSVRAKALWLYLNEMDPDHYCEEWVSRLMEEFLLLKYPQLYRKVSELADRLEPAIPVGHEVDPSDMD